MYAHWSSSAYSQQAMIPLALQDALRGSVNQSALHREALVLSCTCDTQAYTCRCHSSRDTLSGVHLHDNEGTYDLIKT